MSLMLETILALFVSMLLLVVTSATRPTMARCPSGFFLSEGVRTRPLHGDPVGSFACERPPIGGDTDVLTGESSARPQPGVIRSRIYCTGGASPIVVDASTVGCQR